MLIIKIVNGSEVRRLAVEKAMPFETLQQLIKNLFNVNECPKIKYNDTEGDLCTISSQLELEDCLSQTKNNVVRLIVEGVKEDVSSTLPDISEFSDSTSFFKVENSITNPQVQAALVVPQEVQHQQQLPEVIPQYIIEKIEPLVERTTELTKQTHSIEVVKKDLTILDTIERQLKAAFDSIASFMDSLQFVQTCQTHLQNASEKIEQNLVNPLQALTKSKADDFKIQMTKLHNEIKRLKDLLTVEISKIPDAISSLANSNKKDEVVKQQEQPKPVEEKEMQELINSMDFKQDPVEKPASVPVAPVTQPVVIVQPSVPAPQVVLDPATQLLQDDLRKLESMGFSNQKRNLELLAKHNGDMMAVVEALIQ